MKIKVMPFLSKKGSRVGKAAIDFNEGPLAGFQLVGFTICDSDKGLFVQFPASIIKQMGTSTAKPFFFLRPNNPDLLQKLQDAILDVYESMTGFNTPRAVAQAEIS